MDEYYSAIQRLPAPVRDALAQLPPAFAAQVHEIRLRSERPIVFSTPHGPILAPNLLPKCAGALQLSARGLQECFYSLCEKSVHSYESQLSQGFFTIPGGHRVGVAGVCRTTENGRNSFQTITSLNLRVARMLFVPLPPLLQSSLADSFHAMILAGSPGSGKTTLLRSIIKAASDQGKKIAVVDERQELWPCDPWGNVPHIPLNCDVLSNCPKAGGIEMAVRCLGPQIVACDELGSHEEFRQVEHGIQSGVGFICSVHAASMDELEARLERSRSKLRAFFSLCAFLEGAQKPGCIREVVAL